MIRLIMDHFLRARVMTNGEAHGQRQISSLNKTEMQLESRLLVAALVHFSVPPIWPELS